MLGRNALKRSRKRLHSGKHRVAHRKHAGDVQRRGERVIGGLGAVDRVVGMQHALAGNLVAAVGDDLVDVHVGLRARTRLPHLERELPVELAGKNLITCLRNELAGARGQHAKLDVGLGRRLLEDGERPHDLDGHRLGADAEVLVAALGLRAPQGTCRHLHVTHGVVLYAKLFLLHAFLSVEGAGQSLIVRQGPSLGIPHSPSCS